MSKRFRLLFCVSPRARRRMESLKVRIATSSDADLVRRALLVFSAYCRPNVSCTLRNIRGDSALPLKPKKFWYYSLLSFFSWVLEEGADEEVKVEASEEALQSIEKMRIFLNLATRGDVLRCAFTFLEKLLDARDRGDIFLLGEEKQVISWEDIFQF